MVADETKLQLDEKSSLKYCTYSRVRALSYSGLSNASLSLASITISKHECI